MSESIIAQVKLLAMMQEGSSPSATIEFDRALGVNIAIDFPALLAHIATQAEALKVAVEALEKYSDPHKYEDRGMGILVAPDDATAALSRIAALTGETK